MKNCTWIGWILSGSLLLGGAEGWANAPEAAVEWKAIAQRKTGVFTHANWMFVSYVMDYKNQGVRPNMARVVAGQEIGQMLWRKAVRMNDSLRPEEISLLRVFDSGILQVQGHVVKQQMQGSQFHYVFAVKRRDFRQAAQSLNIVDLQKHVARKLLESPTQFGAWFRRIGAEELALLIEVKRMSQVLANVTQSYSPQYWVRNGARFLGKKEALIEAKAKDLQVDPVLWKSAISCQENPKVFLQQLQKHQIPVLSYDVQYPFGVMKSIVMCQGFVRFARAYVKNGYLDLQDQRIDSRIEKSPATYAVWKDLYLKAKEEHDVAPLHLAARMCFMTAQSTEQENEAFVFYLDATASTPVTKKIIQVLQKIKR